jgi:hypothetical protein
MRGHMSRQRHSFISTSWYGFKESARPVPSRHMLSHISIRIALLESTAVSGTKKASRGVNTLWRQTVFTYSVPEQKGVDNGLYLPRLGICDRHLPFETAAPVQGSCNYWQLSRAPTDPTFACGFRNSMRVWFHKRGQKSRRHAQYGW